MEYLIIGAFFVFLAWTWGSCDNSSSNSRGSLNETCPNEGTGDFGFTNRDIENEIESNVVCPTSINPTEKNTIL